MPVPNPKDGEAKSDFMKRCMDAMDGEDMDHDQMVAVCMGSFKKGMGKMSFDSQEWRRIEFTVPIKESVRNKDDFVIKGVAINETVTRNGTRYKAEELEKAAPSLNNKPILKDHKNSVDSIVGKVISSNFNKTNNSVPFEGKIVDEDMRNKIEKGLIQSVSVGAYVQDLVDEEGVLTAKGIDFVELSLVAVPADPNAGFAKAIAESYTKKIEVETMNEKVEQLENQLKESQAKLEELSKAKETAPVKQEEKKEQVIIKMDDSQFKNEVAKLREEISSLTGKIKELTEKKEVKETKDETKPLGLEEKKMSDQESNYTVEKSELGRGYSIWADPAKLDKSKYKRLTR